MNWTLLIILFIADSLASGIVGGVCTAFVIGRYHRMMDASD